MSLKAFAQKPSFTQHLCIIAATSLSLFSAACDGPPSDSAASFSPCERARTLYYLKHLANEPLGLGLSDELATATSAYMAGSDGVLGNGDDRRLERFEELEQLAEAPTELAALVATASKGFCPDTDRVVFSPQLRGESHLQRIIAAIDQAERSIDISIYSVASPELNAALASAAKDRGVSIRVLYDGGAVDNKSDDWGSTTSGRLEASGTEVRWVSVINHHKFGIFDGPRTSLGEAQSATLISGSANWGWSAAERYDENTVSLTGEVSPVLDFQREFNDLWAASRGRGPASSPSLSIPESSAVQDDVAVHFTSANFDVKPSSSGPVLSPRGGSTVVADELVALIGDAKKSIWIASGHLRLRAITEALLERRLAQPDLDVRVYVDQQEYRDAEGIDEETEAFSQCLDASGPGTPDNESCSEQGLHFSNLLHQAGIPVRFKVYAYRWELNTSWLMHHKYIIIDENILATGSYNLSMNSERNSLENIVVFRGERFSELTSAYTDNFRTIWETGHPEQRYQQLMSILHESDDPIPLKFAPMAVSWTELTALREAIEVRCSDKTALFYDAACYR